MMLSATEVFSGDSRKSMAALQMAHQCLKRIRIVGRSPCIRLDKLSDEDEGLDSLCPNWGYAYLTKAEGIHVRVPTHAASAKISAEEEVFVPVGVEGSEILGAIPIYARNVDGSKRNPSIINFAKNWAYFKKLTVNGLHTQDGKGATNGI